MSNNSRIKKSTLVLIAVAIVGISAGSVVHAENHKINFKDRLNGIFMRADEGEHGDKGDNWNNGNSIKSILGNYFFNNSSINTAQKAYNQAVKEADVAYKNAQKAAKNKLHSALSVAGDDFSKILAAYKTYMTDLLEAYQQESSAKQTALQNYINALNGVQTTNQAPTANPQSVTATKNTSKLITLTGTDPEGSVLSFFVVTNTSHGTLSGTVPSLTYLPSTDFTGTDSFTFKVNDGSSDSAPATISITVNP